MHGLAAEITEEVWDFVDCNLPYCGEFHESATGGPSLNERIETLLRSSWDYVVTHNPQGEYHHIQHVGLHGTVVFLLEQVAPQPPPKLLVFNPLPELNVSMSLGKRRMVEAYLVSPYVKNPRLLLFDALTRYAEHLVCIEHFLRPAFPLGLGYFLAATQQGSLHFQYGWALAKGQQKWTDALGDFTADAAMPWVLEMLHRMDDATCDVGVVEIPAYPVLCARLRHRLLFGEEFIRAAMVRMEEPQLPPLPSDMEEAPAARGGGEDEARLPTQPVHKTSDSGPPEGQPLEGSGACGKASGGEGSRTAGSTTTSRLPALLECVHTTKPLQEFGTVSEWTLRGSSDGPVWLELLLVRPILVGWRQGYRGRTFKVRGGSGPVKVDLPRAGVLRVPACHLDLEVQPHDVLGWAVLADRPDNDSAALEGFAGEAFPEMLGESDSPVQCLASDCDDAGLCVFDAQVPSGISSVLSVESLTVLLRPRVQGAGPGGNSGRRASARPTPAPYAVRPALDLSDFVRADSSYEELLTLRQRLEHPELGLFEDKIRLRRELLPHVGAASTPSIHLSHTDTEVAPHLRGRRSFVVKPSHMSESQFVFVVQDGINLLQQAWGHPQPQATVEQIQDAVDLFMNRTALDWECKALVGSQAGVIIEELILAEDAQGKWRVDEYKFYVAWGKVVFGENVPFSSGAAMEIMRDGHVFTAMASCPPFCVAPCYAEMVSLAEQVARNSLTDFLRVDILLQGRCEKLFVSEVELFPASDFSPKLKALVAQRWREGYGFG